MSLYWQIFLIVISSFASLCSGLVLWNFRLLNLRITKVEQDNDNIRADNKGVLQKFGECKADCNQSFVKKEDWLREAGYSREQLEKLSTTLNRIEGKMEVMNKLPEICGSIAKEISKQINKG